MNKRFLTNQIIAGKMPIELNNSSFYICSPSPAQKLKASKIFDEVSRHSYFMGVFSNQEMIEYLMSYGMWNDSKESELETSNIKIDNIKTEMYRSYDKFSSNKVERLRKSLRKIEQRINYLYNIKYSYYKFTCEGIAEEISTKYLIKNNLTGYDEEKVDIDKFSWSFFVLVMNKYLENKLSDKQIREIAKFPYWRSIWNAGKSSESIFGIPSINLSDEQRNLISWSKLYDSIYEHSEIPDDVVINDDDLLDGWLILEYKKRKQEQKDVKRGEYSSGAQETYTMVDTPEDAKRVYDMNESSANFIRRQRMNLIKQKGTVKEQNMPDSKREMAMQATKQFRDRMRRE